MTLPRRAQVSLAATPYYHCVARCVRRAYLCGQDHHSGRNFEHRRQWLLDRIRAQAAVFSIDLCAYAIMSNHYHLVLRVDEQRAASWTDAEVIARWTCLYRGPVLVQRWQNGDALTTAQRQTVADIAAVWRKRLFDLSWYMRCLNEFIARRANAEDDCTGRFWEGRFKSQALLGQAALLACMAYVDLNPVRAGMASSLADSDFTSIQDRIRRQAMQGAALSPQPDPMPLAPFPGDQPVANPAPWLPCRLATYIELVAATGRQATGGKRGVIAPDAAGLLDEMNLSTQQWKVLSLEIQASSLRAVGSLDQLEAYCAATGRRRRPAAGLLRAVFGG
jgi:REP element-mobilizing transposase RayT